MTIAIAAAASVSPLRMKLTDYYGRTATKTSLLDGTIDDTHILQLLNDMVLLSNAEFDNVRFAGRVITGMTASPINAGFKEVTDIGVFTFTRTNPVNSALVSTKTFLLPCIVEDVIDGDKKFITDTAGTGSLAARVGRVIANLQTYLAMYGSDGVAYIGGWTFSAAKSGKVDAAGV